MKPILLTFAALAFSLISLAQQCTNVEFFVMNQSGENWPVLEVDYLISNANGMPTANGTWEVTPNGTTAGFCLSVGCYTISLSGDGVSGESVGLELFQSDFVQILDLMPAEEEGVWNASFCVEQGQMFNCPDAIDYAAGEGCNWAFEIGSFQEGEQVHWNFGDGTETVVGGHFIEHVFENSGTYQITAFFTSFDCPMGVGLATTIEVEGCGGGTGECEVEMNVETEDGMWYTFSIAEVYANANIQWYIDDQPIEGATGLVFEAGFDFNPYWSVCVAVITDACPEGAEACYNNMESDCPEGILVDSDGCHYVFSMGNLDNQEIGWSVDGVFVEWSNFAFDWFFETGGWHVIQAEYYSPNCPGETYVVEINTEGCGGEGCDLELVWNELECDHFFIEALNQPEGATLYWTLDGEPYDYGYAEMVFTFEEDGCHVFGVGYETPECPQGAFAEVEICSDCNGGTDCEVSIVYEELAGGIYLFSAVTETGELFAGDLHWWTGGDNVGSGNPFAWTWDVEEPMGVAMCMEYASWQDCPGGEACIELETPGMACEEIVLVLNGEWTASAEWAFELGFEAFIDGIEIAGWSFEEAWMADGAISDTLTLCVPPACFDVFWGWDAATVDVEALLVSVLLAGGDPVTLFDWFEPFNTNGFGLLPDCLESVEVPSPAFASWNVWPNPANQTFQWTADDANGASLLVHSLDGRQIFMDTHAAATGQIATSDWPAGWYVISWIGRESAPIHQKILVIH
jgi:hypothetical protein